MATLVRAQFNFVAVMAFSWLALITSAVLWGSATSTMVSADDKVGDTEVGMDESALVVQNFLQYVKAHPAGEAAFTFDATAWSGDPRELPVGVFDSGIGGLTVLEAILNLDSFHNDTLAPGADGRRDFENESFVYFGDQANMPYGNYSSVNRQNFLKELILKDAAFLLGRRYWPDSKAEAPRMDKPSVKAIVIACNTATAWGLDEIRQLTKELKVPVVVVGVVEAGSRGLMEQAAPQDNDHTVAVLATVGTCAANAYPKAIGRTLGLAGRKIPLVIQQGSVGLAGAIEGDAAFIIHPEALATKRAGYLGPSADNKNAPMMKDAMAAYGFDRTGLLGDPLTPETVQINSISNYVRYDVATLVMNHRASGATSAIDTVVLGCTHFPLVKGEILSAFAQLRRFEQDGKKPFESLIADSVQLVDPAEMTARELFRELARSKSFRPASKGDTRLPDLFYLSVASPHLAEAKLTAEGLLDRDYKYGRDPMHLSVEDTINVPMRAAQLPATSVSLLKSRLHKVWKRLNPQ